MYRAVRIALATSERTTDGCLMPTLWTPKTNGYIRVSIGGGITKPLHRLVYEELTGQVLTEDMTIDHTCHSASDCKLGRECPHRRCIELTHLEAVTALENIRRSHGTRWRSALTQCKWGHPFSEANTYWSADGNRRWCRACTRARASGRDPREEEVRAVVRAHHRS